MENAELQFEKALQERNLVYFADPENKLILTENLHRMDFELLSAIAQKIVYGTEPGKEERNEEFIAKLIAEGHAEAAEFLSKPIDPTNEDTLIQLTKAGYETLAGAIKERATLKEAEKGRRDLENSLIARFKQEGLQVLFDRSLEEIAALDPTYAITTDPDFPFKYVPVRQLDYLNSVIEILKSIAELRRQIINERKKLAQKPILESELQSNSEYLSIKNLIDKLRFFQRLASETVQVVQIIQEICKHQYYDYSLDPNYSELYGTESKLAYLERVRDKAAIYNKNKERFSFKDQIMGFPENQIEAILHLISDLFIFHDLDLRYKVILDPESGEPFWDPQKLLKYLRDRFELARQEKWNQVFTHEFYESLIQLKGKKLSRINFWDSNGKNFQRVDAEIVEVTTSAESISIKLRILDDSKQECELLLDVETLQKNYSLKSSIRGAFLAEKISFDWEKFIDPRVKEPEKWDLNNDPEYAQVLLYVNKPLSLPKESAMELQEYIDNLKEPKPRRRHDLIYHKICELMAKRARIIRQIADDVISEMAREFDGDLTERFIRGSINLHDLKYYLSILGKSVLAQKYLTKKEFAHAEVLIKKAYEKNISINIYTDLFNSSPGRFFYFLFKRKPYGKVRIHRRSMMLAFECFDQRDYATVHNCTLEEAGKSGGVAVEEGRNHMDLKGTIVGINRSRYFSDDIKPALDHEWRHHIDHLIFSGEQYKTGNTQEKYLLKAKTEILARLTEGDSYEEAVRDLSREIYDYWAKKEIPNFKLTEEMKRSREKYYRIITKMIKIAYEIGDINLLAVTPIKNWPRIHRVDPKKGGEITKPYWCLGKGIKSPSEEYAELPKLRTYLRVIQPELPPKMITGR